MRHSNWACRWIGTAALVAGCLPASAEAAAAKRFNKPYSDYSASLFGKTNLTAQQTQTLAADPDDPLFGSTSITYDVGVVRVTGFGFGPAYRRWAGGPQQPSPESGTAIELFIDGQRRMVDLQQYLSGGSTGVETGYLQTFWEYDGQGTTGHYIPEGEQFIGFSSASPEGVDTHYVNFQYKPGVPNEVPASYRVFDETANRGGGNRVDFMAFGSATSPEFTAPGEIIDAVVSGTVVPEPGTAGLALVAGAVGMLRRSRRRA